MALRARKDTFAYEELAPGLTIKRRVSAGSAVPSHYKGEGGGPVEGVEEDDAPRLHFRREGPQARPESPPEAERPKPPPPRRGRRRRSPDE